MKRTALLFGALVLAMASRAQAQLTMQMSNGWSFTFAGNVNAFLTYEKSKKDGATNAPGGIVPAGQAAGTVSAVDNTRIQTGLLPAFAVFEAKGKEGNTDLTVHFGFAPEVQCAQGVHDCFGAQIDMRQVFLSAGGSWGSILAGRELGLWGRQNILTDQTLFGIGATGNGGSVGSFNQQSGTTLGRIGFGYIYPQFKAQITYTTPAGKPSSLSIGLFEAAAGNEGAGNYVRTQAPRVETEFTYSQKDWKGWVGGLIQSTKTIAATTVSASSYGVSGGLRYGKATWSVTGSGYWGKGVGTTLLSSGSECSIATCGANGSKDLRKSYGFIGQLTVTPASSKVTLAGSYGSSYLKASDTEKAAVGGDFKTENTLISGGLYYQATKSLKVVAEGNYAWTKEKVVNAKKNSTFAPAIGLMLFF